MSTVTDSETQRYSRWAIFGMLTAVSIWGVTFVVVKNVVSSWPVFPFLALRFWIATLSLLPLLFRECREQSKIVVSLRSIYTFGFWAGAALFIAYTTQTYGIRATSVSSAAFITSLYLVFTPLFLLCTRRTHARTYEWIAALLALAGIYILNQRGESGSGIGILMLIICAACYAVHLLIVGSQNHQSRPVLFTITQIAVVAVASSLAAVADIVRDGWPQMTASVLSACIFTGVIATTFCFLIQTFSQRHLNATQTGVLLSLEPLVATVAGWYYSNDPVTLRILFGGILILGALALSQYVYPMRGIMKKGV